MAYKPLSQTVTNGKTAEIPSSDAIFDKIAADIAAIPASANPQLSNLGTTAVNANINMGTNQLRFNAGDRRSSISINALADVATGINAVTPSNAGTTTINTSASITDVLQIGDRIYLDGLSASKSTVLTKPSATQITVSTPLGAGGGGTSRQIYIEPQLLSSFNSTTEQFSVRKDGQIVVQTGTNFYLGDQTTAERRGTQSNAFIMGPGAGRYQTTGDNNTFIGSSAGASSSGTAGTGANNTYIGYNAGLSSFGHSNNVGIGSAGGQNPGGSDNVLIGYSVGNVGGANNVIIGALAVANSFNVNNTVALGRVCIVNTAVSQSVIIAPSGSQAGTTTRTVKIGPNIGGGTYTDVVVIGNAATANSETNIISIGSSNGQSLEGKYYKAYLGNGASPVSGIGLREFRLTTGRVPTTTNNIPATNGKLILSGALSSGTEGGGPVIIATSRTSASGSTLNEPTERMRVTTGGEVAINSLSNAERLSVGGSIKTSDGDLIISKPGKGLKVAEGDNATMGVATLAAGTATVNTSAVKSNSRIMLTNQNPGGTVGFLHVSARTADTSFVITSSNAADTSDVAWMIVNPIEDSDASAFISAASITDATQKRAIIELVSELKAASLWSKMKAVYPFVGGTATAHKFNLKDPQDTDGAFRLVFSGTWTHNSNGAANNTGAYADTKVVPSVNFSAIDNFALGAYTRNNPQAVGSISLGVGGVSGDRIQFVNLFVWSVGLRVNDTFCSATMPVFSTPLPGDLAAPLHERRVKLHIGSSTASGTYAYTEDIKRNVEFTGQAAVATGNLPTNSIWLGGSNDGGVAYSAASSSFSFAFISDKLSSFEAYTLNSIVENYQEILGRRIIT